MDWASIKKSRAVEILVILKDDIARTDIVKYAYAMAYVTLFSLIPSLAASFALVSLFTPMFGKDSTMITQIEDFILRNLATGSGSQAVEYLETFLANTDFQKIGMTGFVGMMVALILLLREIEMALNRIFEIQQARPLLMRFIYFWTFLTLGTFMLAVSIGTLSTNKIVSKYVDVSIAMLLLGDFIYVLSMGGFFFLLYKVVPNRVVPIKHACIGAGISTLFLALAIKFFSLYINSFTSYQAVYGALSAVPIFLFWLYVIWFITLLGALITKRSMEGWLREEVHVEAISEHVRDPYFHALMPFLVLLAIYRSYEANNGKGALPETIAQELGVSMSPVRLALHTLEKEGLAMPLQSGELSSLGSNSYFPRMPAHQLSYAELKKRLLGEEDHWMRVTQLPHAEDGRYTALIHSYLNGENKALAEDLRAS
ncbi:MAG TPA: YihY family inner membrane protein [Oligoflexus sp.]|uniref:YihY family inner membrane protein n=1 Tax=Oligoflexus sp. TaxID=1971216 RepID=UPI002D4FB4B6|nr:YihY family inner membrane protein [Oligoflexus sp.]HYX38919.1 YihY family inner membrane protein [Oligoflexus sp.]